MKRIEIENYWKGEEGRTEIENDKEGEEKGREEGRKGGTECSQMANEGQMKCWIFKEGKRKAGEKEGR